MGPALRRRGKPPSTGRKSSLRSGTCEDDFSFLRNYFTAELAKELGLFAYGPACDAAGHSPARAPGAVRSSMREPGCSIWWWRGCFKPRYHYGVPRSSSPTRRGACSGSSTTRRGSGLDREYAGEDVGVHPRAMESARHLASAQRAGRDGRDFAVRRTRTRVADQGKAFQAWP